MKRIVQSALFLGLFTFVSLANAQTPANTQRAEATAVTTTNQVQDPREEKARAKAAQQREREIAKREKQQAKAQKQREKAVKQLEKAQKKVTSLEKKVSKQQRKVEKLKNSFYVKLSRGKLSDIDEQKERIKISKQELKQRELERDLEKAIQQAGRLR